MIDALRKARHDLRGKINALKLCVAALEIVKSNAERLEFLGMIDLSADATVVALDELESTEGYLQQPGSE